MSLAESLGVAARAQISCRLACRVPLVTDVAPSLGLEAAAPVEHVFFVFSCVGVGPCAGLAELLLRGFSGHVAAEPGLRGEALTGESLEPTALATALRARTAAASAASNVLSLVIKVMAVSLFR